MKIADKFAVDSLKWSLSEVAEQFEPFATGVKLLSQVIVPNNEPKLYDLSGRRIRGKYSAERVLNVLEPQQSISISWERYKLQKYILC